VLEAPGRCECWRTASECQLELELQLTLSAKPPEMPLGVVIDLAVKEPQPIAGEIKLFTRALSEPFDSTAIFNQPCNLTIFLLSYES
jgi:hypothetical protein